MPLLVSPCGYFPGLPRGVRGGARQNIFMGFFFFFVCEAPKFSPAGFLCFFLERPQWGLLNNIFFTAPPPLLVFYRFGGEFGLFFGGGSLFLGAPGSRQRAPSRLFWGFFFFRAGPPPNRIKWPLIWWLFNPIPDLGN